MEGDNVGNMASCIVMAVGVSVIGVLLKKHLGHKATKMFWHRNCLDRKRIEVINTVDECQQAVRNLTRNNDKYKILGFDCEWVTVGGSRRPVALLQLASAEGHCALFRLCQFCHIPQSLRDILEDNDVIKVGVAPQDDAQKLSFDYGVSVASTFDLRFLAALTNHRPGGLANLSKTILNVQLDKNWRISCSNWEAPILTDQQLNYAANDSLVAIDIFTTLCKQLVPQPFWKFNRGDHFERLRPRLEPFYNVNFKDGYLSKLQNISYLPEKMSTKKLNRDQQTRKMSTRSKTFYSNCLLEAPDGELLCTIDHKKAQWYVNQELGFKVLSEPFTVRLNFEPAGRAVGEVGRYYQTPKQNQCVVCGRSDVYIRKNIVPREYRKHFPVVMKSHTSHDILLLCPSCHQISNISDFKVRSLLAEKCDAPVTHKDNNAKCLAVQELKRVRSAGRALLLNADKIPVERQLPLQNIILQYFNEEEFLTPDLIMKAADLSITAQNEDYCEHGKKVVQCYESKFGGLLELERLWREHFLSTMQPNYLPELWNVNHNANRLEIRQREGRVEEKDLQLAGFEHNAT